MGTQDLSGKTMPDSPKLKITLGCHSRKPTLELELATLKLLDDFLGRLDLDVGQGLVEIGNPVGGDGAVDGADMVPDQDVVLGPVVGVAVFGLQHMGEQVVECVAALCVAHTFDAYGKTGVHVDHLAPADRVREKHRVRHRRP